MQHPTSEQDNIPVIDPIETQVHEVPGKKFRMIALKMLRQLQDNSMRSGKQYLNKMESQDNREGQQHWSVKKEKIKNKKLV